MFFALLNYFSCMFRVPLDLIGFSRTICRVCGNMYLDLLSGGRDAFLDIASKTCRCIRWWRMVGVEYVFVSVVIYFSCFLQTYALCCFSRRIMAPQEGRCSRYNFRLCDNIVFRFLIEDFAADVCCTFVGSTRCTPVRNERGAVLRILGDASYCFVDDCAVGLVMHSGEPEQSHSVMHLLVQRQGITLNCEVVSLLNSAAGLEYSNRRVTLRLSCVLLRNKVEVLLCARKMRIQEELWNE